MRRLVLAAALLLGAVPVWAAEPSPPTARQMIRALLTNGNIPLSVHASCKGVGSTPGDVNLRDYVSGLLANFTEPDSRNSIATLAKAVKGPDGGLLWECRVEFVHVAGGDPFKYGVTFQLRPNGSVVRESLRCTGSG
jgi:hypothetical protein